MASRTLIQVTASALLAIASVATVPAQQSDAATGSSGTITAGGDIWTALDYHDKLFQTKIVDMERPWRNLRAARAFLAQRGVAITEADWQNVLDLLEQYEYARTQARRSELHQQVVNGMRSNVCAEILAALPEVAACDVPDDDGGTIRVFWQRHQDIEKIKILRKDVTRNREYKLVKTIDDAAGSFGYNDNYFLRPGREYSYRILAVAADGRETLLGKTPALEAHPNLVNMNRLSLAAAVALLCGALIYYIRLARRGVKLWVRKIAGLEAVDEAVGRATEMGRPIMFVPGIQDMNDIQTVAGLTILGHVARVAAEHDALLEVPTARSLVMTAARDTVRASCLDVGRPDAYNEKKIYYCTDEQFGYVAAVTGAMVREKPATCFYMGAFFAESLILAETANVTGSIQIAGTAQPAQLPFFVAACDYTLIGEEFFAASAYLSGEPQQLGSLKGQDIGKIFGLVAIAIGLLLATMAAVTEGEYGPIGGALDFVSHTLLETAG